MSSPLQPRDVERLIRDLPVTEAPEALWGKIQDELHTPARPVPLHRRPIRWWAAAAALIAAVCGGTYAGLIRSYGAPGRWEVVPLAGMPTVAGTGIDRSDGLRTGEWLETDSVSRAELAVGRIGTAEVGPNSRLRLDPAHRLAHRITLERGSISAVITAPPRLFFVETPTALATDLGCAYVLEVDDAGGTRIHVTAGWVELKQEGRVALVPAGFVAEVRAGMGPGTPFPEAFPSEARQALKRLDRGSPDSGDLELVFDALHPPAAFITLRQESAITLWHLLQRVDRERRERVFARLAALSAPPSGVTMEGILALRRPMLERWRRDLNPMWSEEAQPLAVRILRQLWEWATS